MNPQEDCRWYVARTHAHAESKASGHLRRQGFKTYLPLYLKKRRHARRIETVQAALFPCYIFVALDMAVQRWRSIGSTVGVTHLVCNGDEPSVLPAGVIESLRAQEDERGFVRLLQKRPRFQVGQKIKVENGVFASFLGLFEGMSDHERVIVLLDLFNRKVRVALDGDFVAAA
jgi:transcriptional antiterminator RfaH